MSADNLPNRTRGVRITLNAEQARILLDQLTQAKSDASTSRAICALVEYCSAIGLPSELLHLLVEHTKLLDEEVSSNGPYDQAGYSAGPRHMARDMQGHFLEYQQYIDVNKWSALPAFEAMDQVALYRRHISSLGFTTREASAHFDGIDPQSKTLVPWWVVHAIHRVWRRYSENIQAKGERLSLGQAAGLESVCGQGQGPLLQLKMRRRHPRRIALAVHLKRRADGLKKTPALLAIAKAHGLDESSVRHAYKMYQAKIERRLGRPVSRLR